MMARTTKPKTTRGRMTIPAEKGNEEPSEEKPLKRTCPF
jgi:hypothetical protein